jgi:hypothetical protein
MIFLVFSKIADDFRPDELVVGAVKVEPMTPGLRLEMKVKVSFLKC